MTPRSGSPIGVLPTQCSPSATRATPGAPSSTPAASLTSASGPDVRVLVTGGAGFIGSNFTRFWVERHPDDDVVVLDLLTYAGNRANLDGLDARIAFEQGDMVDLDLCERVLRGHAIDIIVNF